MGHPEQSHTDVEPRASEEGMLPRLMRLPKEDKLPPGPLRALAAELFMHYREAEEPSLQRISEVAATLPAPVQVSRETIRRLLTGKSIVSWPKANAVFLALCSIAGQDPDRDRWERPNYRDDDDYYPTCRAHLRKLWLDCMDGDNDSIVPAPRAQPPGADPATQNSGWGTNPTSQNSGWGGSPTSQAKADDPWTKTFNSVPKSSYTNPFPEDPPF
ncbi:hypothetical protein PUR61_28820 [Streptomyces sp. BE20]|uniref:hypothetical protein n=1 Tax=Streptomyces sp. BE20 TaxID=3002525 RepID=UPI002E77C17E|nr:hypothetical protein [Streptomyces sp. BE20]MEE1826163.1 hypothetical protein [Streptomyces sp. BE20]